MATYRTIRMSFWSDQAVETMSPSQKLLYLYLFTNSHTNNLGLLSVSIRKMAFETGLDEDEVCACLERLGYDGRVVVDGGHVWVCGFIRHQCTTSPKILASLRALFPMVDSAAIRAAIVDHYPHLFGAAPCPADTVSLPSGESEREWEKKSLEREPNRRDSPVHAEDADRTIPLHLLVALQHDFPDVDVEAEIVRIRDWQARKRQPVRNWANFLRTWLSNAVSVKSAHAATSGTVSSVAPVSPLPVFRTPSDAEWQASQSIGKRVLNALRGNGTLAGNGAD